VDQNLNFWFVFVSLSSLHGSFVFSSVSVGKLHMQHASLTPAWQYQFAKFIIKNNHLNNCQALLFCVFSTATMMTSTR